MDEPKLAKIDGVLQIQGDVDDPELAETALRIGYINRYMQGVYEVVDEIAKDLPKGFMVSTGILSGGDRPKNAILIGQVRVRHGDPEYKLYLVRKPEQGRPPLYGEKMKQTAVWLPEAMADWLKNQPGGVSETIRDLINKAMQ